MGDGSRPVTSGRSRAEVQVSFDTVVLAYGY